MGELRRPMPDAAGGEDGHKAAKADSVIHQVLLYCVVAGECGGFDLHKRIRLATLRSPFGGSEVGSIEEASAVMKDRLIKTQQIASSTATCEFSRAYHAIIVRDPVTAVGRVTRRMCRKGPKIA